MRTKAMMTVVALLLAAVAVHARTVQQEFDVHVAGHSSSQMDAARYDVQAAADDVPVVTLPGLGQVQGTTSTTDLAQRTVYSYLGVPFGEAPMGELRFRAPVPKKPWEGVYNSTVPGKTCFQVELGPSAWPVGGDQQSEDCLVLDVHTPKVDPDAKLPVLVFIHGGNFFTGYAGQKPPTALLDAADIVLVSPQYRLGPLGFLNLQSEEVPGNAGLLDLVEALRWVNKNIQYFGGDPSRVTVAGHSAGAASASLLYLSHLTKGLIHGVLPMSGSALGFWAWDRAPEAAGATITQMACAGKQDAVACLRTVPPQQLILVYLSYAGMSLKNGHLGMSGSIPSVQKAGKNETKLLLDQPENILSSDDLQALPYMTGVTKHEGTYPLDLAEKFYLEQNNLESNATFLRNDIIHVLLDVIGNDDAAGYVSDTSLQAYFDLTTLGKYQSMRDGLIDMMGAFGFKSPARRIVQRNSELGKPTYLYAFNHNGQLTRKSADGIYHGADQPYIFPIKGKYPKLVGNDLEVSLALRKYVTNFVIYQNPTPQASPVAKGVTWQPFQRDHEDYMELVWPPAPRQWFQNELTVARRDQFNEGFFTTASTAAPTAAPTSAPTAAPTAAPTLASTTSTGYKTSRADNGRTSGSAAAAPSLALALCLAVLCARR